MSNFSPGSHLGKLFQTKEENGSKKKKKKENLIKGQESGKVGSLFSFHKINSFY